ncbi:hypothetical protein AGMMS50276_30390 [Synergistales bacterium]|nr:hypothetical protein AGMMS50276_30390 [Synergistales bacterium]
MRLYTIGFTKKTAKQFFDLLKAKNIDLLLDIRLNNKTQLAGFTKGDDLAYFLSQICNCEYRHLVGFAPTKELLDNYKNKKISWTTYEEIYDKLLAERGEDTDFAKNYRGYKNVVLLCSEPTAEKCHRRLLAEKIVKLNPEISLTHI